MGTIILKGINIPGSVVLTDLHTQVQLAAPMKWGRPLAEIGDGVCVGAWLGWRDWPFPSQASYDSEKIFLEASFSLLKGALCFRSAAFCVCRGRYTECEYHPSSLRNDWRVK